MRHLAALTLAATVGLYSGQALAQNATEIARARAGASCPGCNLFQADFAGLRLLGRDYSGARLRQADLSLSTMSRTRFVGSDLRDVNGYGGVFTGADFSRTNLTHATFVGAYLEGADFLGADLEGLNLSGAELQHSRGLSQRQLDRACGDDSTRLPRGLHIPPC